MTHINNKGKFVSDKYIIFPYEENGGQRSVSEDKLVLSFKDSAAQEALRLFAHKTNDNELAVDILNRLGTINNQSK